MNGVLVIDKPPGLTSHDVVNRVRRAEPVELSGPQRVANVLRDENIEPAAELAMCGARQGKFWQLHDLLFRTQRRWQGLAEPGSFFLGLADSVGANRDSVMSCMRNGTTRALVRSDAEGSVRSGAHSTPTFYIEGGLVVGAQPMEVFRAVLDSIVRVKSATR